MRVLRGRAADREVDRRATAGMLDRTGETGEPAVRVWAPHRQVAFGRRDARAEEFETAAAAAREAGFDAVERSVGGRAVAYTGTTTLAFALSTPIDDLRRGMEDRYDRVTASVRRALQDVGAPARRGEPDRSFCPGSHSLQCRGKVAGVAQRVRADAALVSGVVVVDDHGEIGTVLDPVYDALDVPFDPDSVGSVARAGGETDPEAVARAVERRLVDGRDADVERVDRET